MCSSRIPRPGAGPPQMLRLPVQRGDETPPAPAGAAAARPAGPPDGPAGPPSRTERVLDAITMAGGLLCVAEGLTVMAAWFGRATAVLFLGSQRPVMFNAALAMAVTGVALVALARGRPRAALVAGAFDAALGTVILAEWALGRSLGIDQLVIKAYISGPYDVPGRPPVAVAVCLALAGAALLAWGPWRLRRHPVALAAAGSLIGAMAITSITGYATSLPKAYLWAHVATIPLLTAVALLVLALALLSAAWRDTPQPHAGPPGWLPMPAGAVAFGIAGAVWRALAGGSGGAGRTAAATGASAVLGLVMASLVALSVWLAQQADRRRRMAVTNATRAVAAETMARDSEKRLFQFLDAMPIGVFVVTQGGQALLRQPRGGTDPGPGRGTRHRRRRACRDLQRLRHGHGPDLPDRGPAGCPGPPRAVVTPA